MKISIDTDDEGKGVGLGSYKPGNYATNADLIRGKDKSASLGRNTSAM